jgi:hypothetical protein
MQPEKHCDWLGHRTIAPVGQKETEFQEMLNILLGRASANEGRGLGFGAPLGWVEGWDDLRRPKGSQHIPQDWGEQVRRAVRLAYSSVRNEKSF